MIEAEQLKYKLNTFQAFSYTHLKRNCIRNINYYQQIFWQNYGIVRKVEKAK